MKIEGYGFTADWNDGQLTIDSIKRSARSTIGLKEAATFDLGDLDGVTLAKPSGLKPGALHLSVAGQDVKLTYLVNQQRDFEWLYKQLSGKDAAQIAGGSKSRAFNDEFEGVKIDGAYLRHKGRAWPIADCEAMVDQGVAIAPRLTATRVALTGPFALLLKKDRSKVYLAVTVPGEAVLVEVKGKKEGKARKFALQVNQAASAARG